MNFDIAGHIGAVARVVENRERDGRPAHAVIATRSYDTDATDLWDALTNAERIPRWFMPISGDLRLGGRYQLTGNASGEITRCEPPKLLAVTWEYAGDVSWVTVTLSPEASGGTRLELEHLAHVKGEFWDRFGPGAVGVGWDLALFGLAGYLSTGASVDPEESAAWLSSPAGKDFVRQSSDGWCLASIAAGTDAAKAQASARRTTAFYSGEPEPAADD
jgi:uncharacterized protein YndB with AHSA1/START domain